MNSIKAVLRSWFYVIPKVGQVYNLDYYNPFGDIRQFTVMETKQGWVKIQSTSGFSYELSRSDFHFNYKKM